MVILVLVILWYKSKFLSFWTLLFSFSLKQIVILFVKKGGNAAVNIMHFYGFILPLLVKTYSLSLFNVDDVFPSTFAQAYISVVQFP